MPQEAAPSPLPPKLDAFVAELAQRLTSGASWSSDSVEDALAVMMLQFGAAASEAGSNGQALLSRFGARIGAGQETNPAELPTLIAVYFEKHPLPPTLLSAIRETVHAFCQGVSGDRIEESARQLLGQSRVTIPSDKHVTNPASLFQFLLKKK